MKETRSISLRYKFLAVMMLMLAAAILAYLFLAVTLFKTDKTAYIYDDNRALVETLAEEVRTGLLSSIKTLRLTGVAFDGRAHEGSPSRQLINDLFRDEENFVDLTVYRLSKASTESWYTLDPLLHLYRQEHLRPYKLDPDYLIALREKKPIPINKLIDTGTLFQNSSLPGGMPLMTIAITVTDEANGQPLLVVAANVRQEGRFEAFSRSSVYTTYLIDTYGNLLVHPIAERVLAGENLAGTPIVADIIASKVVSGGREYPGDGGKNRIVTYRRIPLGNLIVVSEIPTDKAFMASRRLIQKSVLFAVLVFALSFIVSILFTRRLTAALHRLCHATMNIARGNFDIEVSVKTRDEVGTLAKHFNFMAGEIRRLLRETADKARMEKELETAQLVQDNFFPMEYMVIGDYEVAAFFKPASECGGDWWGSIVHDDKLIMLIGDATGHGVPAALITAAAQSCTTTLSWLSRKNPDLRLTPSMIMENLNAAVYYAGRGKVKMTFFVATIDLASGLVRYTNASHDMPLVCRAPEDGGDGPGGTAAERDRLEALVGEPDLCLGQEIDVSFREHEAAISAGDSLVLYTDGLVECRNNDKIEYGERRLLKSYLANAGRPASEIRDSLMARARDFYGDHPQDDDITVVVVKRNRHPHSALVAS